MLLVLVSSQVLLRSRILRENGKYIPRQVGQGTALWGSCRVNLCVSKLCVCVCGFSLLSSLSP